MARVYTVGHSNHEIGHFLGLLEAWGVDCVVDVRSTAASRFSPQYNKNRLAASLKEKRIAYLHLPEEFGARRKSPNELTEGKVDFIKVRKSPEFRSGVERLKEGVRKGYTIALMCAEADPLECHRFSMIAVDLEDKGFEVLHILKDKTIVPNHELEQELLKKYKKKILTSGLFDSAQTLKERLEAAYTLQNREIGYSPEESS
jgi:uncharacterized protein (DUF488 family)